MLKTPAASTKAKALKTLANMETIIHNDRLERGEYLTMTPVVKSDAICGGHNMCAIGALWVGAGVKKFKVDGDNAAYLPGVNVDDRPEFVAHRPALKLAYDALNLAASKVVEYNYDEAIEPDAGKVNSMYLGAMEILFEEYMADNDDMLEVIKMARHSIEAL